MFRWLLLVLVVFAALAGLALGILNPESVSLDLVVVELKVSLGAAVAGFLGIGVLLGLLLAVFLFALPGRLRTRRKGQKASGRELNLPNG